jgi:hypothetical protein
LRGTHKVLDVLNMCPVFFYWHTGYLQSVTVEICSWSGSKLVKYKMKVVSYVCLGMGVVHSGQLQLATRQLVSFNDVAFHCTWCTKLSFSWGSCCLSSVLPSCADCSIHLVFHLPKYRELNFSLGFTATFKLGWDRAVCGQATTGSAECILSASISINLLFDVQVWGIIDHHNSGHPSLASQRTTA